MVYTISVPFSRSWLYIESKSREVLVYFESKTVLERENEKLSQDLRSAQLELLLFTSLAPDVARLKTFLADERPKSSIVSGVLSAPPRSPYDTLVIDAGARDGATIGALVHSMEGVALGTITETFRDFSRVTLFSSPGNEIGVRIGESQTQVQAIGIGNGEFQLLLPRELEIHVGDPVAFPDLLPSIIGEVGSVTYQDVDFLQLVSFRIPVNMNTLRYVLVETEPTNGEGENGN